MALPTTSFDATGTVVPRKSFITLTPSPAGVDGTAVEFVVKNAEYGQTLEKVMRKVPGGAGTGDTLLRPDRIVAIDQEETISFEIEELDKVAEFFGTGRLSGGIDAKCTLYVVDPDDVATKCAVKSSNFKCFVELDGGISFNSGEVSVAKIKVTAKERVELTLDATA